MKYTQRWVLLLIPIILINAHGHDLNLNYFWMPSNPSPQAANTFNSFDSRLNSSDTWEYVFRTNFGDNSINIYWQAIFVLTCYEVDGKYNISFSIQLTHSVINDSYPDLYYFFFDYNFSHPITMLASLQLLNSTQMDISYLLLKDMDFLNNSEQISESTSIILEEKPKGLWYKTRFFFDDGLSLGIASGTYENERIEVSDSNTQYSEELGVYVPDIANLTYLIRFHILGALIDLVFSGGATYEWKAGDRFANVTHDFHYKIFADCPMSTLPNFTMRIDWWDEKYLVDEGIIVDGYSSPYFLNYNSTFIDGNQPMMVDYYDEHTFQINTSVGQSEPENWDLALKHNIDFNFSIFPHPIEFSIEFLPICPESGGLSISNPISGWLINMSLGLICLVVITLKREKKRGDER